MARRMVTAVVAGVAVAIVAVLAVHYAGRIRRVQSVSDTHFEFAMARAWLAGQYLEHGEYPRELPDRIEYGGKMQEFSRRRDMRYEVSEAGERCMLAFSVGGYECKETWERGEMTGHAEGSSGARGAETGGE